uniref:D-glycerate 3-kinase, chloroplastic-like n=1 Tax=Tanacetum cinerariifolium TaxID=118510 RepID=A0A6L2L8U8_TANCI|nr:D-glycerate 3-kinase, chloroplastic-like [Tanacetum cinerariifolium]
MSLLPFLFALVVVDLMALHAGYNPGAATTAAKSTSNEDSSGPQFKESDAYMIGNRYCWSCQRSQSKREDVMNIDGLLSDEETSTSSDSARSSVSDIKSADNCFCSPEMINLHTMVEGTELSLRHGLKLRASTVVLFEGWMLGFKPAPADAIKAIDPYVRQRQLSAEAYHTGRESRVVTTLTLLKPHHFRYQDRVSSYFKDEALELESSALK